MKSGWFTLAFLLAASAAGAQVEIVTVTAEKRAESVMDVGLNVQAFNAEDIAADRILTPLDLAAHLPNVDIKDNIPGAQQIITVRGVGLDDFSSTNNSSVGVYVDDVFLTSFAEMDFNFFDLGSIEVLKGPQGTLYGRNSTAGAINVIAAKPSFDGFSGNVSASYGNFEAYDVSGMLNIPVSSTLALRFSGMTVQQDRGYWFSRVLDRDLGRQDIFLGRAQALWQPTGAFTALLKVEGEHNRSEIGVGKFFGTIPLSGSCPDFHDPSHCVNVHGYTDTTTDPFRGDWNHAAPYRVDQFNATLHLDDDLGWATLSSVTGYIHFEREFYTDADASPFVDAEFDQNDHVNQFSQELRLAGKSGPWDWVTGAYYSWDHVHSFTPGSLRDLFGLDVFIQSRQTTRSAAAFGDVKYALTDQLTFESGLRYTYEDRSYAGGSTFNVSGTAIPFPLFDTLENTTIHDRNLSWREALNWRPDEDTLVYLSASRATKSGGFFNGITTDDAQLAPYKPEHLTDYEAGVKAGVFHQAMLLDASVFYYDYRDMQTQTFTSGAGGTGVIAIGNVPKSTIYGLDFDATWLPTDGLSLQAGLGLLHSRLGGFTTAILGVPTPIAAGHKLPDAPDVTFNANIRYEHAVAGDYEGAIQFGGHYGASNFKEALNTPYLFTGANWVFDARATLAPRAGDWELALWGKNLFNERHVVQATDDGTGEGYRVFNAPRTYGVTLSYKFQ